MLPLELPGNSFLMQNGLSQFSDYFFPLCFLLENESDSNFPVFFWLFYFFSKFSVLLKAVYENEDHISINTTKH